MFEKEAQRSFDELDDRGVGDDWSIEESYVNGFTNGAEFGYNKANEWYYPSKGELPKEDTAEKETLYLLWIGLNDSDYMTGVFSHGRFWCFDSGWFETDEVIAWKEIVLPKESE